MRGTILGVHDGRAVLSDGAERRLEFPLSEWRSPGVPFAGQLVDYVEDNGQARSVFAVPGAARMAGPASAPHSSSFTLAAVALACLVIGFVIPFLPTVAAFVLGAIAAQSAQRDGDDNALLMARIAWIGALVLLVVGFLAIAALIMLMGGIAGMSHMLPVESWEL